MISTSSSKVKLKTSEFDEIAVEENDDSKVKSDSVRERTSSFNSEDSSSSKNPIHTIVICQRDRLDSRFKSRGRLRDEYPMARGIGSRRGTSVRLRGGGSMPRKLERENELNSSYRGKFYNDGVSKGSFDSGFSSKFYSENERTKNKLDFGFMVPEDSRISKLLRKLCREGDPEKSVSLCKQLQDSLMVPENNRYIRRSFDTIAESMLDILHSGPGYDAKCEAAKCLGRVGYVLEQDFKRYMDWIFIKYSEERNDVVRMLLMKAMLETLRLETLSPKLKEFATPLMKQLQSTLEYTDHPEMLIGTVDVIIALQEIYPETFTQYFRDCVDILVGWHLDGSQSPAVARHALHGLRQLRSYWVADLQFSLTLLQQFVEDMEVCGDDLERADGRPNSPAGDQPAPSVHDTVLRLTKLVTVFDTVVATLGPHLNPASSSAVSWAFLADSLCKILATVIQALGVVVWEELVVATNECSCLLLAHLQSRTSAANDHLYELIHLQLALVPQLSDVVLVTMLRLVGKTVREVSANLPLELVQKLLGPGSSLLSLRFSPSFTIQNEVVGVYQSFLNLKNINLLQETYRYVLGDLEKAYKLVVPSVELNAANPHSSTEYRIEDAEMVIMFHLRALADLANASNSIIGMWALQPSIFELLAVKLTPYHPDLAAFSPALQYSLLFLLYSHCTRSSHFVSSSSLVSTKQGSSSVRELLFLNVTLGSGAPTASPTSGHLAVILKLLATLIEQDECLEIKELVLAWTKEVFMLAQPYLGLLLETLECRAVLAAVVRAGHTTEPVIVLGVLGNLQQLLGTPDVEWQPKLLSSVVDLCIFHLNFNNAKVRHSVFSIIASIPWQITLAQLISASTNTTNFKDTPLHELSSFTQETVVTAQRHHLMRGSCGEMQPYHFRKFMGYLLQALHHSGDWLVGLFYGCWPVLLSQCAEEELAASTFSRVASVSDSVLLLWATWEAAQLCVMYKLRTPLGKPQETFTSIEGVIKSLAREISHFGGDDNSVVVKAEQPPIEGHPGTWEQQRIRLLLEFLEHLEKVIYNASDGCALAMLPAPKPVRTFFHTNKSTCDEWLSRIRIAVVVVALHAGEATMAIRNGQCLLQDLVEAHNLQGAEFERAVMYLCWAYCKLREPEAILGLYWWSKEVSGRKFPWLKAAAEQAYGKYEVATTIYSSLLAAKEFVLSSEPVGTDGEEETSSTGQKPGGKFDGELHVTGFMADQLVECYKALNNWTDIQKWKKKEAALWTNQNGETAQRYLLNTVTAEQAKLYALFGKDDLTLASELSKWPAANSGGMSAQDGSTPKCWSSYKMMAHVQNTLAITAMKVAVKEDADADADVSETKARIGAVQECVNISQYHMKEAMRHLPSEFLLESAVTYNAACNVQHLLLGKPCRSVNVLSESDLSIEGLTSGLLNYVLWWARYFQRVSVDLGVNTSRLQLNTARAARKEGNFKLSERLLLGYVDGEVLSTSCDDTHGTLEEVARAVVASGSDSLALSLVDPWKVKSLTEVAKLLFSLEKLDAATQVMVVTALSLSDAGSQLAEKRSRLLLCLAKWLQQGMQVSQDSDLNPVRKLIAYEQSFVCADTTLFDAHMATKNGTQVIPSNDLLVGQLLQASVSACPSLAKSWHQLGAWCYRWGRRVVDAAIEANDQLSSSERAAVTSSLPPGTSKEDADVVCSILSQTRAVSDEEDIEAEYFNTSEMIQSQLQNVNALRGASAEQLCYLVDIWRNAQKRMYSYYELSAVAYFKYLELYGNKESVDEAGDTITIMATLRLLRLIVKHALELQSVLESGLASTPTRPWKGIIPQLFSRLSHPEPYVRRRVSELLCRVTEDAPHLITFPAVVGAATGGARLRDMAMTSSTSRLFSTCCLSQQSEDAEGEELCVEEDEPDNEEDEEECLSEEEGAQAHVLKTCFLAMVDTLSKQTPEAISQVQLLVQELRRITLLWDELWLGTLVQHHAEISRRLAQLDLEVAKVEDNPSLSSSEKDHLIAEKHRIILKPLVFILEQLHAITSVTPETPHEKTFQEKFGSSITEALHKLKHPANPRKPHESWQPMKQLQSRLQQRAQKRSAYSIRMSDVSPALAGLKDTLIAMPGISSTGRIITIAAVDNNIAILPTKTKPKKLVFHGSDGHMYTYLFKGLEDLHLDERIMQFLSIANTMMWQSGSRGAKYRARHYSVIPLGPRSGLISWVDGVTPLFGLYKRWQQREANSAYLKGQTTSSGQPSSGNSAAVMRPSELFYSKLTPLLKERGIANLDNRKEWPLAVLKQVLTELMDETPKDLLAKELWCHSTNAGSWWQTTRAYSYSVAVMSVIGYIIGLGDRHLDNVLVGLTSGEVVHIDYNVCFEKGKTLRVPEKVPFRMTPNIRCALGITGIEGIFRLACEHVLKVMKKGRETLLTLLEAFVYDPLIDWTPGNEAGYTGAVYGGGQTIATETKQSRKELEREVSCAMFTIRIAEMKADWIQNRDDILQALPELMSHLNKWLEVSELIRVSEESLQDCHQQMALVKEAEASPQHSLFTLTARYSKHRLAQDATNKVKAALREKIEECDRQLNLHKLALSSVRGPQLAKWVADLSRPVDKDGHLVFDLVKEFLQNAGQTPMITQCEQSESELCQLSQQQTLLVHNCLDLLSQYGTVASMYPASYLNTHRSFCYRTWAQYLLDNTSVERCREVVLQFSGLFSPEAATSKQQHVLAVSYQLQSALANANAALQKNFERMKAEGIPDSIPQLEANYLEAKSNVGKFLRGEKSVLALECVIIRALCSLNKRYLLMESAAASAGDCLVDLTSREGDWFLDEMHLVCSLELELFSLLPLHHQHEALLSAVPSSQARVTLVVQCLQSALSIYKGLQELNYNFHTIILPEALKTIKMEEPTVLFMIQELDDIIHSINFPLPDLLAQLEMHLRYIVMEMDSPHQGCQVVVAGLRSRFNALLQQSTETKCDSHEETLTPGQMLLMGFNGLFEKLHVDGNVLVSTLDSLDTPACWKKIDQVREAKTMAAPVFNDATRSVLDDIFLLKRLQTMQEFFMLCSQAARGIIVAYDNDHLSKPIRRFTADYVSRQMLGVTSQTLGLALCLLLQRIGLNVTVEVELRDVGAESKVGLEELCCKAVSGCLKRGLVTETLLAQASGLTSALEASWRHRQVARHLQQQLEVCRSTVQRLQLQFTAHHWLHEDCLSLPLAPLSRSSFMLELRKTSSALLGLQPRVAEARERQGALVASVEQRLKWAAGANPALGEVMAAFEAAVAARARQLDLEQGLAAAVGGACAAVLHHEALRTRTSEAAAHDAAFLQLVDQCEKSCLLVAGCHQAVTSAEESLVHLLMPEGPISHVWIHNVEGLISDMVKSLQQQKASLQESLYTTQDSVKSQVLVLRSCLSTHHKLMSEVRNLLKSMVKFEDSGLHDYLVSYRAYAEQFPSLIRELLSDDFDTDKVHSVLERINHLEDMTGIIYKDLLDLSNQLQRAQVPAHSAEDAVPVSGSKRAPLLRQNSMCVSPSKGLPSAAVEKNDRDPQTGKAIQERNAYALGVWRRVRMKLEGRDPDPGRRATVQEQVDFIIREAISMDNLALLYEGWTPWV
ncbi:serine/threonine-protein kinase SMG1 isoform X2 [Bacillus rossius redtenbacheri]|uniref:serine/threonine-protein kinase SMG1 isoform X2 n=1 Tax=Bacillus rossius redtenbacheri TaxID=93214 RepID=UPI002FDEEBE8